MDAPDRFSLLRWARLPCAARLVRPRSQAIPSSKLAQKNRDSFQIGRIGNLCWRRTKLGASAMKPVSNETKGKKRMNKNQRGCETRHHQEDDLLENAKRGRLDPHPSSGRFHYLDFERPTPQECRDVRDRLMALHGFPQEFEEYRRNADAGTHSFEDSGAVQVKSEAGCGDSGGNGVGGSVLDGLVSILLSQNTTDANSRRAFLALKSAFPTWDDVHAAESKSLENAIRCGGLAHTKAHRIKNILKTLLEKKGKICMEYLRDMPTKEIKTELHQFKGLGPKTVACLLMFHLQKDDFPVDTHVFRITKSIGWIPPSADREKAYVHLNQRIPDNLKFDLNCLFVTHGKHCQRCASRRQPQRAPLGPCPLSGYHAG